ncbi:MAG: indole-3-glycerol-phosphate synthase [Candidatus Helarchaeota archaeon]
MTILDEIFKNRKKTLEGFLNQYKIPEHINPNRISLIQRIKKSRTVNIISEIKLASPSKGKIASFNNIEEIAKKMEKSGVVGISILTEPNYFNGSFENLERVRSSVELPILMKDFIFHPKQLYHGLELGANIVLLIIKMLPLDSIQKLYNLIDKLDLEVILELHDQDDLDKIEGFKPKIIGINNRDLETLKVDINISIELIPEIRKRFPTSIIISESGIYTKEDIKRLSNAGADAFLIGSSIMEAPNIELKIKELMGVI